MFKIGEFSKLTKVSVRMLRYYDEAGLLKPAVIDQFTGYRLYATSQLPDLQKILLLRDMEFGVAEIADVLERWNTNLVIDRLSAKKTELLDAIRLKEQRIQKIGMAIQDLESNKLEIHYNVTIKQIPRYNLLSLRAVIPNHFCEGSLWEKLNAFVDAERVDLLPGVNNLAVFHEEGDSESGIDVEVGVLVKKLGKDIGGFRYRETEAVETMACIMVYGPYENIGPAYRSFAYWLEAHRQYEMAGSSRQICHIDAMNAAHPEQYLTEVQTPVRLRG